MISKERQNEMNQEHIEGMTPLEHALCECGEPVPEGEHCKYCNKYMPTGDDLAEEEIARLEHDAADLADGDRNE